MEDSLPGNPLDTSKTSETILLDFMDIISY